MSARWIKVRNRVIRIQCFYSYSPLRPPHTYFVYWFRGHCFLFCGELHAARTSAETVAARRFVQQRFRRSDQVLPSAAKSRSSRMCNRRRFSPHLGLLQEEPQSRTSVVRELLADCFSEFVFILNKFSSNPILTYLKHLLLLFNHDEPSIGGGGGGSREGRENTTTRKYNGIEKISSTDSLNQRFSRDEFSVEKVDPRGICCDFSTESKRCGRSAVVADDFRLGFCLHTN